VAEHAQTYCRVAGLSFIPLYLTVVVSVYLRNIGHMLPNVLFLIVGNIVHIIMCMLLTVRWGMGNQGIAISFFCNYTATLISASLYLVYYSSVRDCSKWDLLGVSEFSPAGLAEYTAMAIPCWIQITAESWYWEINTLIIGTLGKDVLATHVSANNFGALITQVGVGASSATSTTIGTYVGAGKSVLARKLSWAAVGAVGSSCAMIAIMCFFGRHAIASAYTSDTDLQSKLSSLLLFMLFAFTFNSVQLTSGGVLKACGKPKYSAAAIFFCYYIFALPLGVLNVFYLNMGIYGIYAAFTLGVCLMFLIQATFVYKTDFEAISQAAALRVQEVAAKKV
jgi:MATE family multidrug resistance protein